MLPHQKPIVGSTGVPAAEEMRGNPPHVQVMSHYAVYAVEQQQTLLQGCHLQQGPQSGYLASQLVCMLYSAFRSSRRCLRHVEAVTVA
jgi:hypothetical protein